MLQNKKSELSELSDAIQREKNLMSSLCAVRDLFPVPPHAGVLRDLYIDTLADPNSVPVYVKAQLQAGAEAERIRRDAGLRPSLPAAVFGTCSANTVECEV